MKHEKRSIAVIPARGGSKRLPGKNIRNMCGKPLMAWTVEAALGSEIIDDVIVSTDDEQISLLASSLGVEVPFIRPPYLSLDNATTFDTVVHAISFLQDQGKFYQYVVVLQPTSPLRTKSDIDKGFKLLFEKKADGVISVCKTDHPPEWTNRLPEDGFMGNFLRTELKNRRSQDIPDSYRINGSLYIFSVDRLMKEKSFFFDSNIYAYKMRRDESIDIDSLFDFQIAEFLLQRRIIDSIE